MAASFNHNWTISSVTDRFGHKHFVNCYFKQINIVLLVYHELLRNLGRNQFDLSNICKNSTFLSHSASFMFIIKKMYPANLLYAFHACLAAATIARCRLLVDPFNCFRIALSSNAIDRINAINITNVKCLSEIAEAPRPGPNIVKKLQFACANCSKQRQKNK